MKSYSMRASTRQAGFTLVELVVVITILGILAAVALPRFTSLQSDARAAKVDAFAGAVRAAAAQVKATAMVKGESCTAATITSSDSQVSMEGIKIAMSYCYPTATGANGIGDASNIDSTAHAPSASPPTVNRDGVNPSFSGSTATWTILGAADPANCKVTYTQPTGANAAAVVETVKTGC